MPTKKDIYPDYYLYVHRRASDGRVFYVGKGTGYRAWQRGSRRNEHWNRIVAKHGLIVEILETGYQDWYAIEREIALIEFYGRGNLCNNTDGGEGQSGHIKSQETRKKLSAASKGRKAPWCTGDNSHMKTQASKDKMSALLKGRAQPWMLGDKNPMHKQKNKDAVTARCKGVKRPDITGANSVLAKKVLCVETGTIFDSGACAARWLKSTGIKSARQSNISSACTGNLRSAYGFQWKHA